MVTQAYKIKIGNAEMTLPDLDVESFDKLVKDGHLELFLGEEGTSMLREKFQIAVKRGDFELVEVEESSK